MLKTVSKVSSILYILTCVQCIKLFGEESEMAASNTPRNILKSSPAHTNMKKNKCQVMILVIRYCRCDQRKPQYEKKYIASIIRI